MNEDSNHQLKTIRGAEEGINVQRLQSKGLNNILIEPRVRSLSHSDIIRITQ